MGQQARLLTEGVNESDAPARVNRRPIEFSLRLRVRASSDLCHHCYARLPDRELAEPMGNSIGWLGSHCMSKYGQPLRDGRGLVVDNVVNARRTIGDGSNRRTGSVTDLNERPDSAAAADDRQPALSNHLPDCAAFANGVSRTVKHSIAECDPFEVRDTADLILEIADRGERFRETL